MKPSEKYGIDKHSEFSYGNGHSGTGWYVYDAEYTDEGSQFLDHIIQAAEREASPIVAPNPIDSEVVRRSKR